MLKMTPIENERRVALRRDTTSIVTDGRHYRLVKGGLIPERDFQKMFPLPDKVQIRKNK